MLNVLSGKEGTGRNEHYDGKGGSGLRDSYGLNKRFGGPDGKGKFI